MYEGGVRVPFMMQWPGKVPKGVTYDRPVITTDIFATTFAVAGKEMPKGPKRDSVNLLPFLKGEKAGDPHKRLYWRQADRRGLRQGDWKIVKQRGKAEWELFDLANDLSEEKDLSKEKPAVLKELVGEWEKLDGEMVEAAFRQ